jgi:hypothetical protein
MPGRLNSGDRTRDPSKQTETGDCRREQQAIVKSPTLEAEPKQERVRDSSRQREKVTSRKMTPGGPVRSVTLARSGNRNRVEISIHKLAERSRERTEQAGGSEK